MTKSSSTQSQQDCQAKMINEANNQYRGSEDVDSRGALRNWLAVRFLYQRRSEP
ncbi:unnamed protein product [Haemonchus placei]|uniref:Uncharacterized protein n=1 Tax=Haemonchus placei TaxID=6290 RepID=A0A3P7VQK1_HAEPC|nr:unnamed protein product [Haemonchus placei]